VRSLLTSEIDRFLISAGTARQPLFSVILVPSIYVGLSEYVSPL